MSEVPSPQIEEEDEEDYLIHKKKSPICIVTTEETESISESDIKSNILGSPEKNRQSTVGDEECKDFILKIENHRSGIVVTKEQEILIPEDDNCEKDPKMALKAQIASRMKNSTRIADILQNKLIEHSN